MSFNYELFARYRTTASSKLKQILEGQLVMENMPFVKRQAARFQKRTAIDIDLEDLNQAGAIGLLFAIRKYNPEKARFSTYAAWWILREMQWWSAKASPMRRPKGAGLPYKVWRAFEAYLACNGEEATDEQLGVKEGSVAAWKETPVFFPLEDGSKDDDDPHTGKMLDDVQDAEDQLLTAEQDHRFRCAMETLTPEEMQNLRKVYLARRGGDKEAAEQTIACLRTFLEEG